MKSILLPTDFSPASESAQNYALGFAKKINAKVVLFNTYPVPVYVTDVPVEVTINEEIKTEAELMLKRLEEQVRTNHPGIETESISAWGFAADEIIFHAKEKKIDFIVMGTHGAGGLKKLLLGTNTAEVVNKAECAVLAIPEGYAFKEFKQIAFATNCHDEELPAIQKVSQLAALSNASLILLHVSDGVLNTRMENSVLEAFKERVEAISGSLAVKTAMVDTHDLIQGLSEYVTQNNIDLLAIGHHKRSFISQLIHPSISRKIAFHLPSPLLTIPIKGKIE